MEEINDKKKQKLNRLYDKYKPHEKFIIAASARKTVRYIERNTISFPNTYKVLRNNIISCVIMLIEV